MDTCITDFGADRSSLNTAALQAAVDACHDAGGGTVRCPAGTWRTGTVWLKSHVFLYLEPGCTLLGSADPADYNADDCFPENAVFEFEQVTGAHLVVAYRAEDVGILGPGTIDGNAPEIWKDSVRHPDGRVERPEWRPGQMVFFCRCRDVRVRDVRLVNSNYWTLFLHGCQDVSIRGVHIRNEQGMINTDGIDLDCCRKVTVSDCTVICGDDCLTLRAHNRPLGDAALPCEDVAVTNCVFETPCAGVRVGVGEGVIRHCTLSNLAIRTSRSAGLLVTSRYSDHAPRGTEIHDILFSNVIMDVNTAIQVSTGFEGRAPVHDLTFENLHIRSRLPSHIGGDPENPLRNVVLRNVDWEVDGGAGNRPLPIPDIAWYPEWHQRRAKLPVVLALRHARNLTLEHVHCRWGEVDGLWQHTLWGMDLEGIDLHRVVGGSTDGSAAAFFERTTDRRLDGCRTLPGTSTFAEEAV